MNELKGEVNDQKGRESKNTGRGSCGWGLNHNERHLNKKSASKKANNHVPRAKGGRIEAPGGSQKRKRGKEGGAGEMSGGRKDCRPEKLEQVEKQSTVGRHQ